MSEPESPESKTVGEEPDDRDLPRETSPNPTTTEQILEE